MKIKIPEKDTIELEKLYYETNARSSLLAYLIQLDIDNNDKFEKYHKEYLQFYEKYEKAKKEFEQIYIPDPTNIKKWDLDFNTSILTITEKT